jgi:hypothetical protein
VKLRVGLLALVAAMSTAADAQEWPSRPVRFIVPFPAGGSTDVGARLVGEYLSRSLGRQIVDVPTYQEAGIKGLVLEQWLGVFVPAGTPPAIVARLNTDINKALSEAAIREGFMQSAQTAGRRARGRILATRASRFRDLRPPGEGAEHQGRVELPNVTSARRAWPSDWLNSAPICRRMPSARRRRSESSCAAKLTNGCRSFRRRAWWGVRDHVAF